MSSPMNRRVLLKGGTIGILGALFGDSAVLAANHSVADTVGRSDSHEESRPFRLWATSDSHVGTDKRAGTRIYGVPRESLAEAIRQSEGTNNNGAPSFEWDIALHLGDFSGNQGSPKDDEGKEVIRQFDALKRHRREQFYCLAGNHDASGADEPTQWWFRK